MERGFNLSKCFLAQNMEQLTIYSHCLIKDYILLLKLSHQSMDIYCRIIEHVKCVIQRYENHLEDLRDLKQQDEKDKQKDIIKSKKRNVEEQINNIQKIVKVLEQKFIAYVQDDEKEKEFPLVSGANNLKRRSEEKEEDMTKMEVTLETLKEETKICLDSMSNHRLFIQTSNLEFLF